MLPDHQTLREEKFWRYSPNQIASLFEVSLETGLSSEKSEERLALFGRNAISSSQRVTRLKIFLNQLRSPLILVLIIAVLITVAISHYQDAIFIFFAVVVNSVLGFYQENKAEHALSELKTYLKQRAIVIRDGKEREINAEEIVPGDLIRLAQGDRVPADARVLSINDFQVDEAILTGESLPVTKSVKRSPESATLADQKSMIFAGTLVTQGTCSAIVCRTGADTDFGKISALLDVSESEKTPLQAAVIKFSVYLSVVLGILTAVVFVIGIIAGYSGIDMFLHSVALAVSAIPEGLPMSMTVILAVGVERMAKRKGVVRKLVAAEALGSTTVILTDKTGTLTMAKMVLSKVTSFNGMDEAALIARALTHADVLIENPEDDPDLWRMNGRTMEVSLVRSAGRRGMTAAQILAKEHVLKVSPFNPIRKFSMTLIKESDRQMLVFLGAPDIILQYTSLDARGKKALNRKIDALASSGERVLGIASKEITKEQSFSFLDEGLLSGLSFDGLIAFRDPIRPGIKQALERVHQAGIKTVIMTGDHRGTAMAVAREIGMSIDDEAVLDASELTSLSEGALQKRLPHLAVISRVTPFDKLRIVKLFQKAGEIVAMTGDGVNDAPSIKQANIGIAMGSGTEVAQSVADLILLDDNFETIVAAIEEGRQILGNIRKVLVYLLSNVTDGLILIGGSLLIGLPLPLNALQILWVNFFTGSFPAMAFAFEKEPGALLHLPQRGETKLFDPLMRSLILIIGLSTSGLLFVLYVVLLRLGYDEAIVRTFTFAAFGTYTLLVATSVRSLERSILSYLLFSNRYLTGGILIGFVLMAIAIYTPALQSLFDTVSLPLSWVVGVISIGLFNILLIECVKYLYRSRRARQSSVRRATVSPRAVERL